MNEPINKSLTLQTLKRLDKLNFLLIQCNQADQQMICELLVNEGASVNVATHFDQALDANLSPDIKLAAILIDIEALIADGNFSATTLKNKFKLNSLPMIAMSSNASEGDIESCLVAGMIGHISKPIEPDTFVQTIIQYCQTKTCAIERPSSESLPIPNINQYHDALARLGNNQPIFIAVAQKFIESTSTTITDLQRILDNDAKDEAIRFFHTLKGTAATLGLMEIAKYAADTEKQLKDTTSLMFFHFNFDDFNQLIHRECKNLDGFMNMLKANNISDHNESEVLDQVELIQMLDKLDDLMKKRNMRATSVFYELKAAFGGTYTEQLNLIEADVINLDFQQALKKTYLLREAIF